MPGEGSLHSEVSYRGRGPCIMRFHVGERGSDRAEGVGSCTVRSNGSWVMVTWDFPSPNRMTDRHL